MTVGGFRSEVGQARFVSAYAEGMRLLPAPTREADVQTSFGTVRAYQFGELDRPPLVLMPGKASSTPLWATNLATLMPLRPVICLDILGEPGLSVQTRPIRSAEDQAQWLDEALGVLGVPRAHLLGVSFGGWCAVNLAIRRPERVATLITLDPANTFATIGLKVILFSLATMLPGVPERLRNWCLKWIAGGAEAPENTPEGKLIALGMKEYVSKLPAPEYPTDAQLRSISVPTLVLIAGRSIIHDASKAARRARLVPKAEVEVWPEASHAINGEYPERIAARVRTFLAER
ncbi:alpha/beta fold hydrolase [Vitiosangium sp. GDMCC 1.1324]|uniref:alpha/beta fold hydrolase n=1 Tax=Vitiosangium sp. (strain GDMCC 1.1324) TaxID=2138576 RepID=UPI000D378FAC|nr:alpha/beta hydrolase [Vitiosangium sp. GDMCC 1.1324]PTL77577.1 alpha/beta hydrolase [Vitiosangium sp. GDMCC 1.1324]